ncbi:MAG: hypothetical protein LBG90_01600 [Spirochaetaceae bacterium]|jgi:hypothetical protein|nr:hypothetical protein [Spirochaetaceae bacterium]
MKKQILPRFLGLSAGYIGILLLLGAIQFAEKGFFTRQVGGILAAGHYRSQEEPNRYELAGSLSVTFGGMEFALPDETEGFNLVKLDGTKESILPKTLEVQNDSIALEFPEGTKVIFALMKIRDRAELAINALLGEEVLRLELPYRPLKAGEVQELADGQFLLDHEGVKYRFDRALTNAERYTLFLQADRGAAISYKPVSGDQESAFSAKDFIISGAYDIPSYEKALGRWRDQNAGLWGRNIGSANNEDLVSAYLGEAVSRGNYSSAVASVPAAFLNGNRRTYESSVFLGRLDQGLRSLAAAEREKAGAFSQILASEGFDFLKEVHGFDYLITRGAWQDLEIAVQQVRALPPEQITPEVIPGLLEGYSDWHRYQRALEKTFSPENPFEAHTSSGYLVIAEGLRKNDDKVLAFFEDFGDLEYNLRLGKALSVYADSAGNLEWAAIGRSLILTVLALTDEAGTVPARVLRDDDGTFREDPEAPRLSSPRLYRILQPGTSYPQAVKIASETWAWTGATALEVQEEEDLLDIAVTFPVGETHYMLLRGIPLPSKLQLYGIDYRTAPDFERYNSSGWSYSASEETLLLKLRHRSPVEHIRIFK